MQITSFDSCYTINVVKCTQIVNNTESCFVYVKYID